MIKTILYFDDSPTDLTKYSKELAERLRANVLPNRPPPDLSIVGLPPMVDLIVIDYELTQSTAGVVPATYQGGTLASRLAERYVDAPIVILSRRGIFQKLKINSSSLRGVDDWFYKDDLVVDDKIARKLNALMSGFSVLRKAKKRDFQSLLRLLEATSSEADIIQEARPFAPAVSEGERVWDVHQIANWIRHVFMAYPGILYDEMYASTDLGISGTSFQLPAVAQLFEPARYTGVFGSESPRWWRTRLNRIAQDFIAKAGIDGPIYQTFTSAFEKTTGKSLDPSKCVFSGEPFADTVCYVLRKPVRREYSLEYIPDSRPAVMEPARVSFKAILQSNEFDESFLPDGSRPLLKRIRQNKK